MRLDYEIPICMVEVPAAIGMTLGHKVFKSFLSPRGYSITECSNEVKAYDDIMEVVSGIMKPVSLLEISSLV